MPLDDVYLVSPHLKTVPRTEIDALEAKIGFPLPTGYRAYLTKLGKGAFCHNLLVRAPSEVLDPEQVKYWQESLLPSAIENEFWDERPLLSAEELRSSVVFAASDEGDYFVSCPQHPCKLFELPRHESKMYFYEKGLLEPFAFEFCRVSEFNFPFFEPPNSRPASLNLKIANADEIQSIWDYVAKLGSSPLRVAEGQIGATDRVVAFIPDIFGCAWLDSDRFFFFCVDENAHVLTELGRNFAHLMKA